MEKGAAYHLLPPIFFYSSHKAPPHKRSAEKRTTKGGLAMEQHPLRFMQNRLDTLHHEHLYRQLLVEHAGSEAWIESEGQRVLNLSSNNYLGLAEHPELKIAASNAAQIFGCGTGSSRLIAGNSELHEQLEKRLAAFKQCESTLLFNSGYMANIGVLTALATKGDLILSDELNHASIIDGCRLSRATCKIYPHNDMAALETLLASAKKELHTGKIIVVTDSVFSMDGDRAPLTTIAALCRDHHALLVVDEAHATGCIGPGGRGLLAEEGIEYEGTIAISTLSKAMGSIGAFVAGPTLVREYLINVARTFIFTTALPAPVAAASLAAIDILERTPALVEKLQENATFFRQGLQDLGFNTLPSSTHIIPILVGDPQIAMEMAERLLANGVFAIAIRPPTVPAGTARIRTSVLASHSRADLAYALKVFERVADEMGIAPHATLSSLVR
jgi:8-amino-7-oxononanoate synthase